MKLKDIRDNSITHFYDAELYHAFTHPKSQFIQIQVDHSKIDEYYKWVEVNQSDVPYAKHLVDIVVAHDTMYGVLVHANKVNYVFLELIARTPDNAQEYIAITTEELTKFFNILYTQKVIRV